MADATFEAEADTRSDKEKQTAAARDKVVSEWAQTALKAIADPQERADHMQFLSLLRTHLYESTKYGVTATVYCYAWPATATATATGTAAGPSAGPAAGPSPPGGPKAKAKAAAAAATSAATAAAAAAAAAPVASLTVRSAVDGNGPANTFGFRIGTAGNAMVTIRLNGFTGVLTDAVFSPGAFEAVYLAMRVPPRVSAQFRVMQILNSAGAFARCRTEHNATSRTGTHANDRFEFIRGCVPDKWLSDAESTEELTYDVWKRFQYLTTVTDQSLKDWPTDVIGLVRDFLCPPLQARAFQAADVWFKRPGTNVGYQTLQERTA